jgi:CBS domain-containing protein
MAIEDTLCYLIPKNIILEIINKNPLFSEYFMKSFFKNYLDKTYREMRSKNLLFKEGEKLLYTTPVKDIISKKLVTAPEETTIKEAAGIMSDQGISSIIIKDKSDSPAGIMTDRDLRDKVVAKGLDPSGSVREIMSTDLVSTDADSTCFDALSIMIQRNIHHLIVTERNDLAGVITNHDFMLLQGTSPLSILKDIDRQQSTDELRAINERINQTISILLKEGVRATYILRIITELHDRLIRKIIDLSIQEIGSSRIPFAFFVYGAEGRKEETFKTVFRCAIVYNTQPTYSQKKELEDFCDKLIVHLQDRFSTCGLPLFDIHPLGEGISIYGDIQEWEKNILTALRSREDSFLNTARKMLDMRAICGDISIVESLKNSLYKQIMGNNIYRPVLYEYSSSKQSPIGFFKKFLVDESGEQQEKFDVKEKVTSHIVDSLRAMSVARNIHETSTIERINLLSKKGIIREELALDIYSALEFLLHLLMQSQNMKKELNLKIDNTIEPEKLSMLEKKSLKEVFQIIPELQNTVKSCFQHQEATAQ